ARLLSERREGIERLARMLAESGLDHAPTAVASETELVRLREGFDRAVACSPEASVAAYSLADSAILAAATAELMPWLAGGWRLGHCPTARYRCGSSAAAGRSARPVQFVLPGGFGGRPERCRALGRHVRIPPAAERRNALRALGRCGVHVPSTSVIEGVREKI